MSHGTPPSNTPSSTSFDTTFETPTNTPCDTSFDTPFISAPMLALLPLTVVTTQCLCLRCCPFLRWQLGAYACAAVPFCGGNSVPMPALLSLSAVATQCPGCAGRRTQESNNPFEASGTYTEASTFGTQNVDSSCL